RLVLANPPAQDYLRALGGTEVGEALTRLGGQDIEVFLEPREDGPPHEIEVDGKAERVFEVEGRPVTEDAEGGWVLVIREVTQERKTQERIQRHYHLATVGQLAAGIAHDFNNLLTGVIGFAQLVEMRPDVPEAAREDLSRIVSQGHQAAQMIRQILDFSRQRDVERRSVNVIPFLKETMKLLERTLPENIRVETRFEGKECIVQANLTQLQQVITNLAVNARDAMPEGGGLRVRLSHLRLGPGQQPLLPEMEAGDWVVWAVSDTGAGMPPEVIKHIYEPFFTTKPPGQGTGLGLAQVYGIVKQHGGHIDVKSRVGEGTAFTIYLPRIVEAEAPVRQLDVDIPKGQGETILVVEDQAEVLRLVGAILERLNYRALTASNGQEALAVYDAHGDEIALVLTDMIMPKMSGIELVRALKRKSPAVPVIIMTGYRIGQEGESLLAPEVTGWLEKPLSLDRVAQVVSEALKGKG
ncbi:response regulator, partial [bacterium]|nr:response regulator [bacterium]